MPGRNGLDVADEHYLTADQVAKLSRVGRNTVYRVLLCARFGFNSAGLIQNWIFCHTCVSARVQAAYSASGQCLAAALVRLSTVGEGITQPKVYPNLNFIAGQCPRAVANPPRALALAVETIEEEFSDANHTG